MGDGRRQGERQAQVRICFCFETVRQKLTLRYFADQPLLAHPDLTDRHLLVFAFEDYMKRWFFNLLQVLEVCCPFQPGYVELTVRCSPTTLCLIFGHRLSTLSLGYYPGTPSKSRTYCDLVLISS